MNEPKGERRENMNRGITILKLNCIIKEVTQVGMCAYMLYEKKRKLCINALMNEGINLCLCVCDEIARLREQSK